MNKKLIPLESIQQGLKDLDCDVRAAALNACQGREVSLDIIQQGLKDPDWSVRAAALNACQEKGIPIPVTRTIDPPDLVYKRCLAGVIIVAEIPKDANVRGSFGRKCRADKAIIKEVIGDFFGEPVGISIYDKKTTYYAGDVIEIENFDYSDEECSTGFHFFCTKEEAENYN